jgi:hypothetical protein
VSKQTRHNRKKIDPHLFEAAPEMFEDDEEFNFDFDQAPGEWRTPDWWSEPESEARISARRKIERRREREALYSELNDWAGLGKRDRH